MNLKFWKTQFLIEYIVSSAYMIVLPLKSLTDSPKKYVTVPFVPLGIYYAFICLLHTYISRQIYVYEHIADFNNWFIDKPICIVNQKSFWNRYLGKLPYINIKSSGIERLANEIESSTGRSQTNITKSMGKTFNLILSLQVCDKRAHPKVSLLLILPYAHCCLCSNEMFREIYEFACIRTVCTIYNLCIWGYTM